MAIGDDPRYQPTLTLMRIVKEECISDLEEESDDGVSHYKFPTTENETIIKDNEVSKGTCFFSIYDLSSCVTIYK